LSLDFADFVTIFADFGILGFFGRVQANLALPWLTRSLYPGRHR
jgi:hypothetical protein